LGVALIVTHPLRPSPVGLLQGRGKEEGPGRAGRLAVVKMNQRVASGRKYLREETESLI